MTFVNLYTFLDSWILICLKMVQALVCAQDWLKANIEVEIEETFEDLQAIENDLANLSVKDNVIDVDALNL